MAEPRHPLRPFLALLRGHAKATALGTLAGFAASGAALALIALAGWFICAAALAGLTPAAAHLFNFFLPSIGLRFFAVLRTLARYAERVLTHEATFRILAGLRVWFYQRIEPSAPAALGRRRSGDILNRIVADIEAIDNLYLRVISPSLVAGMVSVLFGALLAAVDPLIAGVGWLLLAAAGAGVSLAAARSGEAAGRAIAGATSELRTRLVEGLQGIAEIRLFNAEERTLRAVHACAVTLMAGQRRMAGIKGAAAAALNGVLGIALVTALVLASVGVAEGRLDGAQLALVALVVLAGFESILGLPAAYQFLGRTTAAGRRILEVAEAPPAVAFGEAAKPLPGRYDVSFEAVCFGYGPGLPPVLKGVALSIPQGNRIALVGESGAGKSTLVNLLVRFCDPDSGTVRIGGTDTRALSEADLRRAVVVVSQDSHLFCTTIRENLLVGRPQADEAELRGALAAVRLLEFVDGLPDGLDTWVGEAGRAVSAGQARRIAVARALLRDAPIWVLDEPSEGLDRVTERQLLDSLRDLTRGRTVLFITHRMTHLEHMDAVVVLEGGRVADQGSHAALLARHPRYARWCARMR